jgi:hypothetical protein
VGTAAVPAGAEWPLRVPPAEAGFDVAGDAFDAAGDGFGDIGDAIGGFFD